MNNLSDIGLVRMNAGKISFFSYALNKILDAFVSFDGLLPNLILSVINFILIVIIPLISPVITFLAICEMTTFQPNVFAKPI